MPTLTEARGKVREISAKALEITRSADLTPAQQREQLDKIDPDLKHWMGEVRDLEYVAEKRRELFGNDDGHDAAIVADERSTKSWGQQFVASEQYKTLMNRGMAGKWTSGDVELKSEPDTDGTPFSSSGAGAALIATPTVLPGVIGLAQAPLTVASLFPVAATVSPLIRYLTETVATNGATSVAEGDLKPPSVLGFDKEDETLHKIATFLPVTDEMLEDWAQLSGYIDGRLRLFVQQEEEDQLLNANGAGADLVGLYHRTGLATQVEVGTAPSAADDTLMDAIFRQITAIRTSAWLEPDAIVIDPLGWQDILLSKTEQGVYYANGPFVGAQPASLWGKRVVVSPKLAARTALVGCFAQGAQIFRKGGITVEASNSHVDYFQRNLTALRAEERLGLAVYRPACFGPVKLTAGGGGG